MLVIQYGAFVFLREIFSFNKNLEIEHENQVICILFCLTSLSFSIHFIMRKGRKCKT